MATTISNTESGLSVRNKLNDIWDGLQLNEIAASKGVTAVDVFVYDTSKDSDGGAWRKRTQNTSWYNETLNTATRGARREFPAVAVIVAEAGRVTIYDGDDPALPMWMVFNTGSFFTLGSITSVSSIAALNGVLAVTKTTSGVRPISFIADNFTYYSNDSLQGSSSSAIALRNSGIASVTSNSAFTIVNSTVNDVAMTVLPDAPIDPATGLPVPTIAVATDGGVSVIRDDGTVVDLTKVISGSVNSRRVVFLEDGGIAWSSRDVDRYIQVLNAIPDADYSGDPDRLYSEGDQPAVGTDLYLLNLFAASHIVDGACGGGDGVTLLAERPDAPEKGMVAYTTSTYNTGWMNGDIKGAFLSSTDTASLVGSGELVTNGTFDTDISGWTNTSSAGGAISWNASGYLDLVFTTGIAAAQQIVTTVAGRGYTLQVEHVASTAGTIQVFVGTTAGGSDLLGLRQVSAPATGVFFFVASGTSAHLSIRNVNAGTCSIDNVSVKLADADRSVNNKGLIVNGTVTRTAVATGAELVAYSGFSAANYLEQPYNSGLDFGTGDFCVMGWMNQTASAAASIIDRFASSRAGAGFEFRTDVTGRFVFFTADSGGSASYLFSSLSGFGYGVPVFFTAVRSNGSLSVYINGRLDTPSLAVNSGTVRNISNTILSRVGLRSDSTVPFNGSLALLRISATAPTAEQIKKVYEDEKFLFQEDSACTLYGASDAVTALAHDDSTQMLHVGTSAGRSVFQGLRRVSNTTTAVGTAISASNSLVVEE